MTVDTYVKVDILAIDDAGALVTVDTLAKDDTWAMDDAGAMDDATAKDDAFQEWQCLPVNDNSFLSERASKHLEWQWKEHAMWSAQGGVYRRLVHTVFLNLFLHSQRWLKLST